MSDNTSIEWTDSTWNPVTGCTKVSAGCDHCYAETFAERFRGTPGHYFERGFDVQLRPDKLDWPLRKRKPQRIFVNSMSDLFHDQVPDDYIAKVFAVMADAEQHTFQLLTKRHARMRSLLTSDDFRYRVHHHSCSASDRDDFDWPLRNVWLGVSTEDQKRADRRIPALLDTPAAVRFISAEPLLGPIDLIEHFGSGPAVRGGAAALDWVIVGGESGRGARPMHSDWPRSIKDQCVDADVPFLFKQWGEYATSYRTSHGVVIDPWGTRDPDVMVELSTGATAKFGDVPGTGSYWTSAWRVGKKAAGRELDGRTWNQYPAVAGG